MKINYLLLIVFLIVSCEAAIAQVEKGLIKLSPEMVFSSESQRVPGFSDELKTNAFGLSARAGYFISDNVNIGLELRVHSITQKFDGDEVSQNGVFIGPYLEYMIDAEKGLYFPISIGIGYNSVEESDDFNEITLEGVNLGVRGGVEYIFSQKVGIRFSLGYDTGTVKNNDFDIELDVSQIGFQTGFSLYFN